MLSAEDPDFRLLDEETFTEMKTRALEALACLEQHPAERICVVTHLGFLQMLTGMVLFGDRLAPWMTNRLFYQMRHKNTGLTYIKREKTSKGVLLWQLVTWNDQSHFG